VRSKADEMANLI